VYSDCSDTGSRLLYKLLKELRERASGFNVWVREGTTGEQKTTFGEKRQDASGLRKVEDSFVGEKKKNAKLQKTICRVKGAKRV